MRLPGVEIFDILDSRFGSWLAWSSSEYWYFFNFYFRSTLS